MGTEPLTIRHYHKSKFQMFLKQAEHGELQYLTMNAINLDKSMNFISINFLIYILFTGLPSKNVKSSKNSAQKE